MAHLLVVKDGGKIYAELLHSAQPMRKGALTVTGAACGGMVMELSVKELTPLVKCGKMGDILIGCKHTCFSFLSVLQM